MSRPREPDPVKLISSLFASDRKVLDLTIEELAREYGHPDWVSPELFFDRTQYYVREMSWPLYRRFISFAEVIEPDRIADIKLRTNALERKYIREAKRTVNIDPGYVTPERLILATGKNYTHRVYLAKGIYADLTLIFRQGSFQPLEWTYPDYAESAIIEYFNAIRKRYLQELKGRKSFG